MERELLTLKDLSKYYTSGQQVVMALHQLDLSFRQGEFVAITGESGSGKSTLAHVLGGILPYENGELYVDGAPTSHYDSADWEEYRRSRVSFVSQDYGILPGSTVLANVISALRLVGLPEGEARERAEEALRRVDLWALRGRRAAKLSSGQKQRLAIARALAKPAPILIADEPTGNLDPENSAAVIRLLAEAAKDRLVILITHEFDEAADAVTRRIVLRDGKVTMDARLRDDLPLREKSCQAMSRKGKGLGRFIAGLQLRSRPVWSGVMLGLFALTAFALFAFAGTFLANLDDTFTRKYDNSAFRNGNSRRVVVIRPDGEDFTDGDVDTLLSLDHVEWVEEYSYLNDLRCGYIQDEHYNFRFSRDQVGEGVYDVYESVFLKTESMPFARSVPEGTGQEDFLSAGRMPETVYEVVAGDESLLGRTFPLYLQDEKIWGADSYLCFEVTVVGITHRGGGIYLHRDLGRALTGYLRKTGVLYLPVYEGLEEGSALIRRGSYQIVENYVNDPFDGGNAVRGPWTFPIRLHVVDYENWERIPVAILTSADGSIEPLQRLVTGEIPSTLNAAVGVRPEDLALLAPTQSDQISLYLEDYAYTDRVLEELHALGYAAISPYREGSTTPVESLRQQRANTLRICGGAFAAVLILLVMALRSMFSLSTDSYRILSHMGLDCRSALRSVYLQVLLLAVVGQAAAIAAVFVCRVMGVPAVVNLLHYLTPGWGVGLSLLHLAASLFTALGADRALRRKLYPNANETPDLDWSQWEVRV